MQHLRNSSWVSTVVNYIKLFDVIEKIRNYQSVPAEHSWPLIKKEILNGSFQGCVIKADGLHNPPAYLDLFIDTESRMTQLGMANRLTKAGWSSVTFESGTLFGSHVYLSWHEVERTLASLTDRDLSPPKPKAPVNRGGKPESHDWQVFWIEVAHYAAKNDLKSEHRHELQKHMEEWTAENMNDPAPHITTIRQRLSALYKARATEEE